MGDLGTANVSSGSVAGGILMCDDGRHVCYCGKTYVCTVPNWVCPTRNDDEDSSLCDECLEKEAIRQQEFWDEQKH